MLLRRTSPQMPSLLRHGLAHLTSATEVSYAYTPHSMKAYMMKRFSHTLVLFKYLYLLVKLTSALAALCMLTCTCSKCDTVGVIAGGVMSYALDTQSADAQQRDEDFNHFVIFDAYDVIACHDFQVCFLHACFVDDHLLAVQVTLHTWD